MKFNYKLGCDPECFLFLDGQPISAHDFLPGSKKEPYRVSNGYVQPDGLAAEFNIDPVDNPQDWLSNIDNVFYDMKTIIKRKNRDVVVKFTPYVEFDKEYFDSLPKECKVLGCDPDFNYQGKMNPAPEIRDIPVRTAAGHIHIGWTEEQDPQDSGHFEDCRFMSEYFHKRDVFSSTSKEERERINYYGMLGSFRPKSYGVELRSPSNLWLKTNESRLKMYYKVMTYLENLEKEVQNAL